MRTECISEFVSFNDKTYSCPISVAMNLVGGKWKTVIIYHLQHGPKRFSELRNDLVSATDATLTHPPLKTVYSLTDFGRTFLPALQALTQWGNQVVAERGQFM